MYFHASNASHPAYIPQQHFLRFRALRLNELNDSPVHHLSYCCFACFLHFAEFFGCLYELCSSRFSFVKTFAEMKSFPVRVADSAYRIIVNTIHIAELAEWSSECLLFQFQFWWLKCFNNMNVSSLNIQKSLNRYKSAFCKRHFYFCKIVCWL